MSQLRLLASILAGLRLTVLLPSASVPAIVSIFALWLVFFLVYVIFYNEIFGLTRWERKETNNANYYTFWAALVLLILQSTGSERSSRFSRQLVLTWSHRSQRGLERVHARLHG